MDYIIDPIAISVGASGGGDICEGFFKACTEIFYFFSESFSLSSKAIAEGGNTLA
jgi:hypothetical protein